MWCFTKLILFVFVTDVVFDLARCQTEEIVFIAVGDWGDTITDQQPVADAMARWAAANNPEFVVSTGDNFYPNGVQSITDPQWNSKWVNVYDQDSLVGLTWYVSVGNHDYTAGDDEWNQVDYHYQVTNRWYLPQLWYSFNRTVGAEEVLFVAIDTEGVEEQKNNYTQQLIWLDNVLSASTAKWKIVFGHFPVYSTGNYGPAMQVMIDNFVPIFEQNNIDFYLSGHDHNLQHISNIGDGGIDYVITGAGGRDLYDYVAQYERALNSQYEKEVNSFQYTFGYVTFHISEASIRVDHWSQDDELVYSQERIK